MRKREREKVRKRESKKKRENGVKRISYLYLYILMKGKLESGF